MLAQQTIDAVRDWPIDEIVAKYNVALKKVNAKTLKGCCPLPGHEEKTPSFQITPHTGRYHCFGCGKSGDGIKLVMEIDHLDYISAIEQIAEWFSIPIERDGQKYDPAVVERKLKLSSVNRALADYWSECLIKEKKTELDPWTYVLGRGYDHETAIEWQLGYAPGNDMQRMGKTLNCAEEIKELHLVNDKGFDLFWERLMFPIIDHLGKYVGFGGRAIKKDAEPKYLNGKETPVYNKSKILYGLYQAQDTIRKRKQAILVEGYTDVISMHKSGATNTVATCGTSLTEEHCRLIKKFTLEVILCRDGDKAGTKAALRDIDILTAAGIATYIFILPEKQDPDDYAKGYNNKEQWLIDHINENKLDAIIWKAGSLIPEDRNPRKLTAAKKELAALLYAIKDEVLRESYIAQIADEFDLYPDELETAVEQIEKEAAKKSKDKVERILKQKDQENSFLLKRIPDDAHDDYTLYRFFERKDGAKTGYFFPRTDGDYERLTNFVITPLFHLRSFDKNVRLVELEGFDPYRNQKFSSLVEFPSNEMLKKDMFASRVLEEGPYLLEASFTNFHLSKLNKKIMFNFKQAWELTSLGWQSEGFWAYANKAWKDALYEYDRFGIVTIEEKSFYSPSASDLTKGLRDGENIYKNDMYHSFKPVSITFEEWSLLVQRVYGDNGLAMIGFAIATINLDIVKRVTQMPLFYPYGAVESGKSTLAASLSALFFDGLKPFNLSSASTDYAFFALVERYCNCNVQFNEFDEHAIKDEQFRFFKALFDDETRERGSGRKGKTQKQSVNSSVTIIGQYLSTKDDNSVLSRAIPCLVKHRDYTQDDITNFNKLVDLEKAGLTGLLTQVLVHRKFFEKNFYLCLIETEKEFRQQLNLQHIAFKNRTLKTYATLSATIETINKAGLKSGIDEAAYKAYCLRRIGEISSLMSESNMLAEFWKMVEFLLDKDVIVEGWDFKVVTETNVTVMVGKEQVTRQFETPTKVLYIRLSTVFPEYAKAINQTTQGKKFNDSTLITYLKDQAYYIGLSKGTRFVGRHSESKNTSAYMLNYEKLGVNLEKASDTDDDRKEEEFDCMVYEDIKPTSLADKFTFTVRRQREIPMEGDIPKTETEWTTCFITKSDKAEREIIKDARIRIRGLVSTSKKRRNMDVINYTLIGPGGDTAQADGAAEPDGMLF